THAISVEEAVVAELNIDMFCGVKGDVASGLQEVYASVSIGFPETFVRDNPVLRLVFLHIRREPRLVIREVSIEAHLSVYHAANLNATRVIEYRFVELRVRARTHKKNRIDVQVKIR